MSKISFYFDEMMRRRAAEELSRRGYAVAMASDVEMAGKEDFEHLAYATEHGLVLVTFDRKFAGLTSQRTDHAGLICLTSLQQDNVGGMVRLLSDFAASHTSEEAAGHVFWLK